MKRILFIEDDASLLELYECMMASEGDQWCVSTAPDGLSAMKLIRDTAFDVVASDMRMPGMTGAEVLTEVRKLHPQTSRVIISGSKDQAEVAQTLGFTHQFLAKPFDLKTLIGTINRIGGLDKYLQDEKLKSLVSNLRTLPSFPTLHLEIMEEIESPGSTIQGIAKIVAQDPGITAKILQVANSAALGLSGHINDPVEAVQQLGMNTVRSLALSAQVFKSLQSPRNNRFSPDALWQHLMQCAHLAHAIMRRERADAADTEDAFTAGMMHDIGKLMLADSLPADFEKALALAAEQNIPLHEAEQQIFGATHAGIAAYLLGLWGLPAAIVEAVAFHHQPENSELKALTPLTAVHVANALIHEHAQEISPINTDYLAAIGQADRLDDWRDEAASFFTA